MNNADICRLCLAKHDELWLLQSEVTFDDGSSMNIVEAFQKVTNERDEEVNNPLLPRHLCSTCLDLLASANTFREKYEHSRNLLKQCYFNLTQDTDLMQNVFSDELETSTLPKLHSCPVCLQKFTALDLKAHCRTHKSLEKYFKYAPKFNRKMRFYARPRSNECLFYRKNVTHLCPYCQEEVDRHDFKDHVTQHKLNGNFRCSICNRMFLARNHLTMHHLWSHKREAPYECPDCGKGFFSEENFKYHKLTHVKSSAFKCTECDKSFSNPRQLRRHCFLHEKNISYKAYYKRKIKLARCNQCQQKFTSQTNRDEHTCQISCSQCHRLFGTAKQFKAHVCTVRLTRTRCESCQQVFQLSSSLKAHKYRCPANTVCYVCGKSAPPRLGIEAHLRTHFPVAKRRCRTFRCARCKDQTFGSKAALLEHIVWAHLRGELPHKCRICSRSFFDRKDLLRHRAIGHSTRNATTVLMKR